MHYQYLLKNLIKSCKKIFRCHHQFSWKDWSVLHNLKTNKMVSINADTVFPTASMVKIPILIGIMDKINKGELDYHQELKYRDSLFYAGVDILGSFKDTSKIELSKVMMLSLTMSDNTASLWLQSLPAQVAELIRYWIVLDLNIQELIHEHLAEKKHK